MPIRRRTARRPAQLSTAPDTTWAGLETLEPRLLLSAAAATLEMFAGLTPLFVENQGQWSDTDIHYAFRSGAVNVGFTEQGPLFELLMRVAGDDAGDIGALDGADGPLDRLDPLSRLDISDPADYLSTQFSVSFVGSQAVTPVGLDQTATLHNYFIGDAATWRTDVPTFETILYADLYDGVDLYITGQRDNLKYDFHVAPGGDYHQVRVRYDGIAGLSLADDGSLRVDLGEGWQPLTDAVPYVYQEIDGQRVEVESRYVLLDDFTYGFELTGEYDPAVPLVLDPELAWSTYLGGSLGDWGAGIAVDAGGAVLVTGYTRSSGWASGGFDTTYNGGEYDAFVAKLSTSGGHLWSTYLGGSGDDRGGGIAVDAAGNVLVTGSTWSYGWVSGGFDTMHGGRFYDVFVAKLNASGDHLWSTYLGGGANDVGYGIAVDAQGDVLVTGGTWSFGSAISGGFDTTYNGGEYDAFVAKLSSSGDHIWSTYLGGSDWDIGHGIAVDAAGNVLVTGETYSPDWVSGGFDTTYGSNDSSDAFVAKLSSSGGHLWSTYLGGSYGEDGLGIAVDAAGAVLVTGSTDSSGWVSGGFDTTYNGGGDVFVAKLSPTGDHIWSTYLGGGDSWENGFGIAVDAAGNVLVTGWTESPSSGWVSGGFDTTYNGNGDAFLAKLSATGGHLWSSYLGGSYGESGKGLAVDAAGSVLVTGYTQSAGWVSGGFDTTHKGHDAFVAKIAPTGIAGDFNGDGVIDAADINPFIVALTNKPQYLTTYGLTPAIYDTNGDGLLNTEDINPFIALLTGGGAGLSVETGAGESLAADAAFVPAAGPWAAASIPRVSARDLLRIGDADDLDVDGDVDLLAVLSA